MMISVQFVEMEGMICCVAISAQKFIIQLATFRRCQEFVCNFCKSNQSDALDSEKQYDKHFRGKEGIHEDPKEFFKGKRLNYSIHPTCLISCFIYKSE